MIQNYILSVPIDHLVIRLPINYSMLNISANPSVLQLLAVDPPFPPFLPPDPHFPMIIPEVLGTRLPPTGVLISLKYSKDEYMILRIDKYRPRTKLDPMSEYRKQDLYLGSLWWIVNKIYYGPPHIGPSP